MGSPQLIIGAIIDSITPAQWVCDFLERVNNAPQFELRWLTGSASSPLSGSGFQRAPTEPSQPAPIPAARRFSDWLLTQVIDHPRFHDKPCHRRALSPDLLNGQVGHTEGLTGCHLIINLTDLNQFGDDHFQSESQLWNLGLDTLEQRVRTALLNRDPFIWVHLWHYTVSDGVAVSVEHSTPALKRISSHALPCQSFSISDLQRAYYCALPNVLYSRVHWVSQCLFHGQPLSLAALESAQGYFEHDKSEAETNAAIEIAQFDNGHSTNNNATEGRVNTQFSNWREPIAACALLLKQTLQRIHRRFYQEHWELAITRISDQHTSPFVQLGTLAVSDFKRIGASCDVVWADPHISTYNGQTWVFYERIKRHSEDGEIDCMRLHGDSALDKPINALKCDYHLSYPFIFCYNNVQYMIPETASRNAIMLFRATDYPRSWIYDRTLIDRVNAADSTLFQYQGRWWMMTNFMSHRCVDERDELHIFFADEPLGPWQPHALNPVLTGVDRARMAGAIVSRKGQLYRPSQYGGYRYGRGINLSKIERLTPDTYRESPIARLEPQSEEPWEATHTLSIIDDHHILIDRMRYTRPRCQDRNR